MRIKNEFDLLHPFLVVMMLDILNIITLREATLNMYNNLYYGFSVKIVSYRNDNSMN